MNEDLKFQFSDDFKRELNSFILHIYLNSNEKGWYDGETRTFGDLISLCHAELSESIEAFRENGDPCAVTHIPKYNGMKPEGVPSELADCIIRIFDMCAHYEIDIVGMLEEKHNFNTMRPYRHGNKIM